MELLDLRRPIENLMEEMCPNVHLKITVPGIICTELFVQ